MAGGLAVLAVLVSAAVWSAAAQQPEAATAEEENPPGVGIKVSFRPSVAIVVGIFTMIFSLTFILLMYAKFCHPSSSSSPLPATLATTQQQQEQQQIVSKAVIESLPFFRFATLRGARQGMECAVCLSRFDDADVLRLLPRCRHAFHLDCVDRWLHSNASCPLCRSPIHADDATLGLKYASSARIVFGGGDDDDLSSSGGRDLLDIFVERVPSSRFPHQQQQEELDRHRHRIIVSDTVFKSRWSELNSADLTEILSSFPSPPEPSSSSPQQTTTTEKNRLLGLGTTTNNNLRASLSEIVSLPRLLAPPATSEEENRRWLPIARRTARRFAGRANKQQEDDQEAAVHVAAALGSGV